MSDVNMVELPGYKIDEKISSNGGTEVYRGRRIVDNLKIVAKKVTINYPHLEKLTSLKREYESLNSLKQLHQATRLQHEYEVMQFLKGQGTVLVYGMEKHAHNLFIIMEDGGEDLQRYLQTKGKIAVAETLALAISIVECLDKIHRRHIIHKNINPANLLLDIVSHKVSIIDFATATTLDKEMLEIMSFNNIEGTIAYLAPEQTGRMNRGIDYRSDYYSLGVTLYQLLTGILPFQSEDPIELVQAHISQLPVSPLDLVPGLPMPVGGIVMKLLAKIAEERYQSAFGLIYDLKQCVIQLQQTGKIENFTLGTKDFSDRLQIPEKLYGRKNETAFLLDTFARVNQGHSEFLLISGNAGIGKSSLVNQVQIPMVEKRGYFISGKYDQLKRNVPYAPIIQALDGLIQQILTEDDEKIVVWRERILKCLGPNASVMTEVLPSLIKIIGAQLPLQSLGPTETQNRFILVFQSFIHSLATKEHPLVMFLDDMQWVDLPSLKLLRALLSQPDIQYLLIIGAYRDNEVDATHSLMLSLENFKHIGIVFETLHLAPLQVNHIQQLLADTLSQDENEVLALATVCYAKTLGNPFFLNQFLRTLYEEEFIQFNSQREFWHWEIDKIKARRSTDNVVDLVVNNINKLSPEARLILEYAACLGSRFDFKILCELSNRPAQEIAKILQQVMQEDFVVPLDETYKFILTSPDVNPSYQFFHDRIQQAAYSLLDEAEKKSLHLKIGRHLQQKLTSEKQEDKLFDIVNQLNLGANLITIEPEKIALANLNLRVGIKVTASAAYPVALNYFNFGLSLLAKDAWKDQYNLAMKLYTHAAEAAYLSDHFSESDRLGNEALSHSRSLLDQVKVYKTKIYTEIARNSPGKALEISLEVLNKLGIKLPQHPKKTDIIFSLLKTKWLLLGKSNKRLMELPLMTDPYKLSACDILSAAIAPAYYAVPELYPLLTLALLNLSIRYGYNSGAPVSYASYGIILCGVLNNIKRGNEFGQIALKLVERHRAIESEVKVSLIMSWLISPWQEPYRNSLAPLLVAHLRGIETGDFEYSAYAAYFYIECAFYVGIDLFQVAEDAKKFYEICKNRHTHEPVLYSIKLLAQVIENLRGLVNDPCDITGTYYQEATCLPEAFKIPHEFGLFNFYSFKAMLNYLFYNDKAAYEAIIETPTYLRSVTASPNLKNTNFFESLIRLSLCHHAAPAEKKLHLAVVKKNQKQMQHWARYASCNASAQFFLVSAELAYLKGQREQAQVFYDQAIQLAEQNEYIQLQALANELAAKFFLAENNLLQAKKYMIEAHRTYCEWGALAKVKQLEAIYTNLFT